MKKAFAVDDNNSDSGGDNGDDDKDNILCFKQYKYYNFNRHVIVCHSVPENDCKIFSTGSLLHIVRLHEFKMKLLY
jgi:hypothetical protein